MNEFSWFEQNLQTCLGNDSQPIKKLTLTESSELGEKCGKCKLYPIEGDVFFFLRTHYDVLQNAIQMVSVWVFVQSNGSRISPLKTMITRQPNLHGRWQLQRKTALKLTQVFTYTPCWIYAISFYSFLFSCFLHGNPDRISFCSDSSPLFCVSFHTCLSLLLCLSG